MRLSYFLILIFFSSQRLTAQFCHPQDSLELVKFYNSVNGQNSTLDWVLTQPVKTWEKVGLKSNGRVKSLLLSLKNLSGMLPTDLNLPELTLFRLSSNQIKGSIPKFDLLPKLTELELGANKFTGSIPNFDNPNLVEILLGSNQLTGEIPKFNLPILKTLHLENNQLSGEIPEFETPLLDYLQLSDNQLSGSVPNFQNLPKLTTLYCQDNQLSGSLPAFENLVNLGWLNFDGNQLTGGMPQFKIPELRSVSLRMNQFSGTIPSLDLPNLFALHLHGNQFSGEIPNMNLPKASFLEFTNNQLTGKIPDFGTPFVNTLRLEENRFTFSNFEELVDPNQGTFSISPQAKIPLLVSGNLLSVSAGGTLANNTFFWYKDSVLVAEKVGDSSFIADVPGKYFCKISNSILSDWASGDSLVLESEMRIHVPVSADDFFKKMGFRVIPNPISDDQPLQIFLENDFFGEVKFEILSLDGRQFSLFEKEKTAENQVFELENLPAENSFWVRVSDQKASVTRLVFKI